VPSNSTAQRFTDFVENLFTVTLTWLHLKLTLQVRAFCEPSAPPAHPPPPSALHRTDTRHSRPASRTTARKPPPAPPLSSARYEAVPPAFCQLLAKLTLPAPVALQDFAIWPEVFHDKVYNLMSDLVDVGDCAMLLRDE